MSFRQPLEHIYLAMLESMAASNRHRAESIKAKPPGGKPPTKRPRLFTRRSSPANPHQQSFNF